MGAIDSAANRRSDVPESGSALAAAIGLKPVAALQTGRSPRVLPQSARQETHDILVDRAPDTYWAGAVRNQLKIDPDVLK